MGENLEYERQIFRSRNDRNHEKPKKWRSLFGQRRNKKMKNVPYGQEKVVAEKDKQQNNSISSSQADGHTIKIKAKHLSKRFEMLKTRSDKLKALFGLSQHNQEYFWALRDVSFEVLEGQTVAIVGLNGSGKSTLLKTVSGFIPITTGSLEVNGAVSEIAVNAGLRTKLSGRDNIYLRMYMSGFTKKQVNARMDEIIEFSELGKFIDQPVKSYSSGMRSKLGFSIMIQTDPDIMIIDEALSVGDSTFAAKSFAKIKEFKERGKTIFFVSHSDQQVAQIADKVIWMHYGRLVEYGDTDVVLGKYQRWQKDFAKKSKSERKSYINAAKKEQSQFNPVSRDSSSIKIGLTAKEKRHAFLFGTARSNLDQVHFGVVNWAIVGSLIGIFMAVSLYSIQVASQTRNAAEIENAKILKRREIEKQKKLEQEQKESKEASSSSSVSIPEIDEVYNSSYIPSVSSTIIPATPNYSSSISVVAPSIPDSETGTPVPDTNSSQNSASDSNVNNGNGNRVDGGASDSAHSNTYDLGN